MNPYAMALLLLVAVGAFAYQVYPKLKILKHLAPEQRFDRLGERLKRTFLYGIVQKTMFRRPLAGLAHMFIFATFLATQLATIVYFIRGFKADFHLPLPTSLLAIYNFKKDVFWILALLGVMYWFAQRVIIKPWRFKTSEHKGKAIFILGLISSLAISEFLTQGAELLQAAKLGSVPFSMSLPASSLMGMALSQLFSFHQADTLMQIGFWWHVSTVLLFLNLLPGGKHFHVLFAIPNIFTSNFNERGHVAPTNLETATQFGIANVQNLTWKEAIDTYSCTECGRCLESCPTALTDKPLTHRGLNIAIKEELARETSNIFALAQKAKAGTLSEGETIKELVGESNAAIDPETVWACTTCGSCEVECPVFIEQVPRIIKMRQNLVLMRGEFPAELNRTFKGMEQHSNPWGINAEKRDAWAEGLEIPRLADIASENQEIPLLYWIGCAGSFDDRVKKITLAMVKILKAANVPFCILGKEEGCTGDSAKRLGNEYLFQQLAQTNIEILKNYKVKRILTHCPHCLQTLKHDYKALGGGQYEVVHHTELLAELIEQGAVKPQQSVDLSVAFHDSCYLTRYNGIVTAPRKVLKSIPSLKVIEFDNNGDKGVCCGAGGGRFWMEEKIGKRINHHRLEDGLAKKPQAIGSACPFCLTMLSDGVKDKGLDDSVQNKDIAEIVAASLL